MRVKEHTFIGGLLLCQFALYNVLFYIRVRMFLCPPTPSRVGFILRFVGDETKKFRDGGITLECTELLAVRHTTSVVARGDHVVIDRPQPRKRR